MKRTTNNLRKMTTNFTLKTVIQYSNLKTRNFQTKWSNDDKGLWYKANAMLCPFCRLPKNEKHFEQKGCSNFTTTTF